MDISRNSLSRQVARTDEPSREQDIHGSAEQGRIMHGASQCDEMRHAARSDGNDDDIVLSRMEAGLLPASEIQSAGQIPVNFTGAASRRQRRIAGLRQRASSQPVAGSQPVGREERQGSNSGLNRQDRSDATASPRRGVSWSPRVTLISVSGSLTDLRVVSAIAGEGEPEDVVTQDVVTQDPVTQAESLVTDGIFQRRDIETGHGERDTEASIFTQSRLVLDRVNPYMLVGYGNYGVNLGANLEMPIFRRVSRRSTRSGAYPLENRRRIETFLAAHSDENLSALIRRLARFDFYALSPAQSNTLGERIERVLEFYESHPSVREGMEDIASVSIARCHDDNLGGLLTIENFIGEMRLISRVHAGEIDERSLYGVAQQYFAAQCLMNESSRLAGSLGSTEEAIEIQLLLTQALDDALSLPVQGLAMQNGEFALRQFESAMMQKCRDDNRFYNLEAQINAVFAEIRQKIEDKHQLLNFMAGWAPACTFVDKTRAQSGSRNMDDLLDVSFEHLDQLVMLSQKEMLTQSDELSLQRVMDFLSLHRAVIPESVFEGIIEQMHFAGEHKTVTNELCRQGAAALTAIRDNLSRQSYETVLQRLYTHRAMSNENADNVPSF